MEDLKKTAKVIYDEDGFIDIKDTTDTNLPHEIFMYIGSEHGLCQSCYRSIDDPTSPGIGHC